MSTGGIEGASSDYPCWREASPTGRRRKGPHKNVAQVVELDGGTLFGHGNDFVPVSNNLFVHSPEKNLGKRVSQRRTK